VRPGFGRKGGDFFSGVVFPGEKILPVP